MMASSPTASPIARERYSGEMVRGRRGILGELRAPRAHALGQPRAPRGDARLRHLQARLDRLGQRLQRVERRRPARRDRSGSSASDSAR